MSARGFVLLALALAAGFAAVPLGAAWGAR